MVETLIQDAVTFFVVVNPIGLVPLFIAITRQESPSRRNRIALRGVLIAAVILVGFIALGQILLDALGISLPSFRIAGGLVLTVIAMKMILEDGAMPFIAGPGTIMAAVLLTDNNRFSIPEQALTTVVLLAVLVFTYTMLLAADKVHRLLGTTGANVLSRVLGLVLAALAVEATLTGIREAFSLN